MATKMLSKLHGNPNCIEAVRAHAAKEQAELDKQRNETMLEQMLSQMNGAKQTSLSHAEKPKASADRGLSRMFGDSPENEQAVMN